MRNEFSSEKLGSRVPNCTRKEYSEILAVHFITEDRNKAKSQKEYQTRGTKKYTKEGIIDRLSAKPYNFSLIAPRKSSRDGVNLTGDERSYYYGYYTLGTEKIAIQLKYPDVKRMATIEEIGYNDAKSGISLADLPKEIKENREYLLGYKKALEELGGEVIGVACIADRTSAPIGMPIYSAIKLDIQVHDAENCPLCKEGKIELVKPGSREFKEIGM